MKHTTLIAAIAVIVGIAYYALGAYTVQVVAWPETVTSKSDDSNQAIPYRWKAKIYNGSSYVKINFGGGGIVNMSSHGLVYSTGTLSAEDSDFTSRYTHPVKGTSPGIFPVTADYNAKCNADGIMYHIQTEAWDEEYDAGYIPANDPDYSLE